MKTPESTPASDHQLMQDQAELIVELRKQLRTAREALKPLAALADAYDAELRSRGIVIPDIHEGDDSCAAFPLEEIVKFLRKRSQPHCITMREACAARAALSQPPQSK